MKNSILQIDHTNQLREGGMSKFDAIGDTQQQIAGETVIMRHDAPKHPAVAAHRE